MVLGLPKSWQLLRRCSSLDQPGGKSWPCLPDRQPRLCSLQRHSQPPFSSCQSCDLPPPCHPIHPFIHPTGSVRSVPDRSRTVRVPVVQSCPSSASSQLTAKVSKWEWAQTSGLQRGLPTQVPARLLEIEMVNYFVFILTHRCTRHTHAHKNTFSCSHPMWKPEVNIGPLFSTLFEQNLSLNLETRG